jgi:hypothetical protein
MGTSQWWEVKSSPQRHQDHTKTHKEIKEAFIRLRVSPGAAKPAQARLDFTDSRRLKDEIPGFEICVNLRNLWIHRLLSLCDTRVFVVHSSVL